jgi:hypothetical protein
MHEVRLRVFRWLVGQAPYPAVEIDLFPNATCHLFASLPRQCKQLNDAAVGFADLPSRQNQTGEFVICEHPISGSRYAGLLPIEPADDFFRPIDLKPQPIDLKPEPIDLKPEPIDLKPERIDLKPEEVPFPNGQPSTRKRPRRFARLLIAFCTGVAGTLLWQSYGDAAREIITNSYARLGWLALRPALTTQNPRPHDVVGLAAPAAPSAEKLSGTSFDLDAVGQNNIATTIGADREPTPRSTNQIAIGQEQEVTTRNTDQIPISDQAPATKASKVTVASRGDGASLQPAAGLTEARPPQTLAEKAKPLSTTSGHDGSCFASASAVQQNHPGASPTWTMRARGHEGTMCWYAAARPRGNDRRSEGVARREIVGTEDRPSPPPPPYGRGGSWEGGLP